MMNVDAYAVVVYNSDATFSKVDRIELNLDVAISRASTLIQMGNDVRVVQCLIKIRT